jgi:hypothetical protein
MAETHANHYRTLFTVTGGKDVAAGVYGVPSGSNDVHYLGDQQSFILDTAAGAERQWGSKNPANGVTLEMLQGLRERGQAEQADFVMSKTVGAEGVDARANRFMATTFHLEGGDYLVYQRADRNGETNPDTRFVLQMDEEGRAIYAPAFDAAKSPPVRVEAIVNALFQHASTPEEKRAAASAIASFIPNEDMFLQLENAGATVHRNPINGLETAKQDGVNGVFRIAAGTGEITRVAGMDESGVAVARLEGEEAVRVMQAMNEAMKQEADILISNPKAIHVKNGTLQNKGGVHRVAWKVSDLPQNGADHPQKEQAAVASSIEALEHHIGTGVERAAPIILPMPTTETAPATGEGKMETQHTSEPTKPAEETKTDGSQPSKPGVAEKALETVGAGAKNVWKEFIPEDVNLETDGAWGVATKVGKQNAGVLIAGAAAIFGGFLPEGWRDAVQGIAGLAVQALVALKVVRGVNVTTGNAEEEPGHNLKELQNLGTSLWNGLKNIASSLSAKETEK